MISNMFTYCLRTIDSSQLLKTHFSSPLAGDPKDLGTEGTGVLNSILEDFKEMDRAEGKGSLASVQAELQAHESFKKAMYTSTPASGNNPTSGAGNTTSRPATQQGSTASRNTRSTPALVSSNSSQGQSGQQPQVQPSQSRPGQANAAATSQANQSNDYILLCFKVKKYLTLRHDLGVLQIQRDQDLFKAFRDRYNARFRWLYRTLSLYTVQRMHFIKVNIFLQITIAVANRGASVYSSSKVRS